MAEHRVSLIEGPLGPAASGPHGSLAEGVCVVFEGIVRPTEDDRRLLALDYEAYEPMTSRQLETLCCEIAEAHGVSAIAVEHSHGRVRVGEVSFRLTVRAAHRKEGLAAMDAFIDRMKAEVALWKRPVFEDAAATPAT